MIKATKLDNVYLRVDTDDHGTLLELRDYFAFQVPNYRWNPLYKNNMWDGHIRLFNAQNQTLYIGLLPYLKKFAEQFQYQLAVDPKLTPVPNTSPQDLKLWANGLTITIGDEKIKPRYYQMVGLWRILENKRCTLVAPTSAGKTMIPYLFCAWLIDQAQMTAGSPPKIAIVVPTTNLVEQMQADFADYSKKENVTALKNFDRYVHKIYSGREKVDWRPIYVTTWQSIYNLPKNYFNQFDAIMIDEAHGAAAKSLKGLLEKCQAEYRVGLTGTMQDPEAHKWVIEGLLGKTIKLTTMSELQKRKWVANLKINCVILDHDNETKKQAKGLTYHDEIKLLLANEKRTDRILTEVGKVDENSFVLFDKVEFGQTLHKRATELFPDKNVYLVYGATSVEERELIRKSLETERGSIVIASYKVFSTGISINNLHYMFFAEPVGKSKFRLLQSIGRTLRLHKNKDYAVLYDFIDKLTNNKSKLNYTMAHFSDRVQRYNQQGFDYQIEKINI